ncbi:hypothetical protein BT96DRAFT_937101 [Gymnopus androsaceus JB14]|uniref:DUF6534 domain-containing protein n=1 Tax=Gymnopus androsaceus JB14 TaxID=1447944 RepID=A0A6A4HZL4_9AGAR|nr:hypothetical protein BT96DRAFT_937101 [Gymnopus androsaceus JB14]
MSGLPAAEQAEINLSVGAVVVSNYLSYLTMGIVLCATWTYFSKFPDDKWWFKTLVILCVSMCIGDTVATGFWSYDWAVANYANPAALAFRNWAVPAEPFFFSTCGLIVQLFYAWRVWIMSMKKNRILPAVIGCLSILGWCMILRVVIGVGSHKSLSELALLIPVAYVWLGASAGADLLITSSMIYYLDLRFRIQLQQAQVSYHAPRRFRRLIVRTVECNLLSLIAQTIAIGLVSNSSIGFWFVITDMTLAKVYTFSLLISLNSRRPDNGTVASEGGFSSSRGGEVELNAIAIGDRHTLPNPRISVQIQLVPHTVFNGLRDLTEYSHLDEQAPGYQFKSS